MSLSDFNPFKSSKEILLFLFLAVSVFYLAYFYDYYLLLIAISAAFVYLLSYRPVIGLYLMVALFPFIDWQIYLSGSINLPAVDLMAIITFLAFSLQLLRQWRLGDGQWPYFWFFLPLAAVCLISVSQSFFYQEGLKYFIRPILFSYVMFFVLPYNLVRKKEELEKILWIIFGLGAALSIMGLASLFLNYFELGTFYRARPIVFGSFAPLGNNQNLLAEALVIFIPLNLILIRKYYQRLQFFFLFVVEIFMIAIALLTFSRAAWLTLILQFSALLFFIWPIVHGQSYKQKIERFLLSHGWIILAVLLPVFLLMLNFSQSFFVESSNLNRSFQWKIGSGMLSENILFGSGPGTFTAILNLDPYYFYDFGTDIEAHGLVLKLLAETGILGLSAMVLFLGTVFFSKIKFLYNYKNQPNRFITLSLFIVAGAGIVLFQLFNTSYFTAKMWLPLGLILIAFKLFGYQYVKKN